MGLFGHISSLQKPTLSIERSRLRAFAPLSGKPETSHSEWAEKRNTRRLANHRCSDSQTVTCQPVERPCDDGSFVTE